MRILLVEDDEALCAAVAPLLEREGYRVDVCRDGDDALYYMRQRMFGLCILDRMLPGRDGLSVLRAARAEGLDTPVLMTTALGLVGDRVDGLDAGADDYLVKPFDVRELLARYAHWPAAPLLWRSPAVPAAGILLWTWAHWC